MASDPKNSALTSLLSWAAGLWAKATGKTPVEVPSPPQPGGDDSLDAVEKYGGPSDFDDGGLGPPPKYGGPPSSRRFPDDDEGEVTKYGGPSGR